MVHEVERQLLQQVSSTAIHGELDALFMVRVGFVDKKQGTDGNARVAGREG